MSQAPPASPPARKRPKWLIPFLIVDSLIVALVVFVAVQPNEFRVSRQASMSAPASAVFAQVNDLHNWNAWSPWDKRDPAMKKTFEGPSAGKDASYAWAGNSEVGEGKMTITDSRPDELIQLRLEFTKPFAATNTTEFAFQPSGDQTNVVWSMSGTNNFVGKIFSLLMNMDKMIGADFEQGLANLKSVVETAPAAN